MIALYRAVYLVESGFQSFPFTDSEIRIEKIHSHRESFLRIIDEMAAIITVTEQLYLQIYWVSAKTGFDKRRRWSQSFPLPNFSVKVLVVEAGDFRCLRVAIGPVVILYFCVWVLA